MKISTKIFGYVAALFFLFVPITQARAEIAITNLSGKQITLTSEAVANMVTAIRLAEENDMRHMTNWILSIMMVESRAGMNKAVGLPNAHASRRSYGVMQVTMPTARHFVELNRKTFSAFIPPNRPLTDNDLRSRILEQPAANILLGILVLRSYLEDLKGDRTKAVSAYNMGIGNALRRPNPHKTEYVRLATAWKQQIKEIREQLDSRMITVEQADSPIDNDVIATTSTTEQLNGLPEETESPETRQGQYSKRSGQAEAVQVSPGDGDALLPSH